MFKSLGLLQAIPCPDITNCSRIPCIFSHSPQTVKRSSDTVATDKARKAQEPQAKRQKLAPSTATSSNDLTLSAISRTLPPRNVPSAAQASPAASTSKAPVSSTSTLKASAPLARPSSLAKVPAVSSSNESSPAVLQLQLQNYTIAKSHTPYAQRNQMLRLFNEQYQRLYANLLPRPDQVNLATQHASDQELVVYTASTKNTYKNTGAQTLNKLKKRKACQSEFDQGTNDQAEKKVKEKEKREKAVLKGKMIEKYGMKEEDVKKWEKDFVWVVPPAKEESRNNALRTEEGFARDCSRCKKNFLVKADLSEYERTACNYHWGKLVSETVNGKRERLWSCCRGPTQCAFGAHVFQDADPTSLHARQPFKPTADISTASAPLDIAAIDCELIYTTAGMSLARLTVCSGDKKVVLDEHVRPDPATPLDYATRFSGIKAEDISSAQLDFEGLRTNLGKLIGPDTLLIGHGLDNDLKALRLIHRPDRIIDTSILFPHPAGYRHSLRNLSKMHLGIFIQDRGYHDSKEDALIALELVKVKYDQEQSRHA